MPPFGIAGASDNPDVMSPSEEGSDLLSKVRHAFRVMSFDHGDEYGLARAIDTSMKLVEQQLGPYDVESLPI